MNLTSMTNEQLTSNLNLGIDVLMEALYRDKVLTEEQYHKITNQYAVVVKPKDYFTHCIDRILNKGTDNFPKIVAVKVL